MTIYTNLLFYYPSVSNVAVALHKHYNTKTATKTIAIYLPPQIVILVPELACRFVGASVAVASVVFPPGTLVDTVGGGLPWKVPPTIAAVMVPFILEPVADGALVFSDIALNEERPLPNREVAEMTPIGDVLPP